MKHTQGPWDIHETYTIEIHPLWDDAGDHIIAEIPEDATQNSKEKLANAHLMATAPELLEACEYTIEKLRGVKGKAFNILPILSAIRKARGEHA